MHLFESQVRGFMLAGGVSVDAANVGKESANMIVASCSRKVCSSCLTDNPPSGRVSPIEVMKGGPP